jgi:hypothetical protein
MARSETGTDAGTGAPQFPRRLLAEVVEKAMTKRPEWILKSESFTTTSALAREIDAWLEFSACKLIVRLRSEREREELENEMESRKPMGRVKVEVVP